MLSVGEFAKLANVSTRTVRYYESIGLLPKSSRAENNYRYYNQQWLERMHRIRELQNLGFGLEEIKTIITFSNFELNERLRKRLLQIDEQVFELQKNKEQIVKLLSVSEKIEIGLPITETERNFYMEAIKQQIIEGLKSKYSRVTETEINYLQRDHFFYTNPQMSEYIEAVKKCVRFAKENNFIIGPCRGSAPASISLYGLGLSQVDPMKYDLIPERIATQVPFFHIDVEFERGQQFVDFCREVNKTLSFGEIQAFKMPLLDVIQNVHKTIDKEIDYDSIDENSDVVLNHFRFAEIEKIFQFDFSKDALVMNYERFFPEYLGLSKITEYLKNIRINSFNDIIHMTALWRPYCDQLVERINLFQYANKNSFSYDFLPDELKQSLKANYGMIIYHEDIIRIINYYTQWDLGRCNLLRRLCLSNTDSKTREADLDWIQFTQLAPQKVVDLVAEESKWAFCQPHAISFAKFTKQSAVLKSLHKDIYFSEIEKFEQKHGFTWDDIGIRMKGVSLHQG